MLFQYVVTHYNLYMVFILGCFIYNKTLPGNNIVNLTSVTSAAACQTNCQLWESCEAFVFNKNKNPPSCNLKNVNDINLLVAGSNFIFGPKYCPGRLVKLDFPRKYLLCN